MIAARWCCLLLAPTLSAQEVPPRPQWLTELSGTLHQANVDVSLGTTFESTVAATGVATEEPQSAFAQLFDLGVAVDLERAGSLSATTLQFAFSSRSGDAESVGAAAAQGSSGLDADNGEQLYAAQLTYEPTAQFRFSGGLMDSNETFAALDSSDEFVHASAGTSPTILGMPTWPETTAGAEMSISLTQQWQFSIGGFMATPRTAQLQQPGALVLELPRRDLEQGVFTIAELGWRASRGGNRIGAGAWHDSSQVERRDLAVSRGSTGAYALWENGLYQRGRLGVDVFSVVGWTQPRLTDTNTHAMVGLRLRGPLQQRPDDSIGILASLVGRNLFAERHTETVWEAYYRASLSEQMHLQVGAILTQAPAGSRDNLVFGFRFSHSF